MDINVGKILKFIGSSNQLTKNRLYFVFKNKQGCHTLEDIQNLIHPKHNCKLFMKSVLIR